ncbi:S-methyl-5-thioribose kinase [Aquibacillus kalidii]|uniref:S-methyl-5-thioribose kinase n=1 Tax=Aquibacillus kalidii TaxID=2762597 RepID=UPI0016487F02|nr:S-methyl-5-thioribose kinase [Aquibacillus kalidii]
MKQLTEQKVIDLIETLPTPLSNEGYLSCEEIGDGNMNYVFRVYGRSNKPKSIIVKQALPFMRSVGPSWPLSTTRIEVEYKLLTYYHSICSCFIPDLYYFNSELSLIVMEDLTRYQLLRKGLMKQERYAHLPSYLGEFLANVLFYTSEYGSSEHEIKEMNTIFLNREMCKITEDFIFTFPFIENPMNNYSDRIQDVVEEIYQDRELHNEIKKLKQIFMTEKQALIHGDLHTGSIMIKQNEMKIIDGEFAFYGPIGFDIGVFFANILISYVCHVNATLSTYPSYLLSLMESVWESFEYRFLQLIKKQSDFNSQEKVVFFLQSILNESIGFAGCEMLRRVLGTSSVEDIETIKDEEKREKVERFMITIGRQLVLYKDNFKKIRNLTEFVEKQPRRCGEV